METFYNQKPCHGSTGYEGHVYRFPIVNTRSVGSLICQCFVTQRIIVLTVRKVVMVKFLIQYSFVSTTIYGAALMFQSVDMLSAMYFLVYPFLLCVCLLDTHRDDGSRHCGSSEH